MIFFVRHVLLLALFAVEAHAFYFENVQNVYIEASDGKAYDFYVNGHLEGSGKRIHYKGRKDEYCKIEVVAKIGDQIYGIEEVGNGYVRESRGFAGNILHDMALGSDSDKGCPDNVVVNIVPEAFIHLHKPTIVNSTHWTYPVKNKDFLIPKKMDWGKSPYGDE